jgi:hypothetical protein
MGWRAARVPVDLLGREAALPHPPLSDPVVEAALKSVTFRVNLATGLSHPDDRSSPVRAFPDPEAKMAIDSILRLTLGCGARMAGGLSEETRRARGRSTRGQGVENGHQGWRPRSPAIGGKRLTPTEWCSGRVWGAARRRD